MNSIFPDTFLSIQVYKGIAEEVRKFFRKTKKVGVFEQTLHVSSQNFKQSFIFCDI